MRKSFSRDRIVASLKSPQFYGFFISVAIMAIISLAFFYPADFEGLSLRQADMQQGLANGQEGVAFKEATGEKALWTNSLFGGMPTFQISPEYPSNSLFSWIDTVYGLGLPAPANLLFMMMFGFLILLYVMRMRWYFALLGAIAWGFSSYFIIIIGAGHIWKFLALTYVPPTIAGMLLCYRGRYAGGCAMTAVAAMMQLNANHPQMTYYFGLVMGAISIAFLVAAIRDGRMRRWLAATGCVLAAGLLALGANAPSLYNTYEYSKETKRSQSELTPLTDPAAPDGEPAAPAPRPTGGMPYHDIVGWSYGGAESFSLLIPDVKGGASAKPVAGSMKAVTLSSLDDASEYASNPASAMLDYFTQYFNDSEGTNGPVYVGAIILALFLMGCVVVRGPMKWALLVMTVVSLLLALGRNLPFLTDFMIYNFPLYNKFRAVESILVIAEFCIPLLAVMCLWHLFRTPDAWIRHRIAFYVSFGLPVLVCLVVIVVPSVFGGAVTSSDQYVASQFQRQVMAYMQQQPGITPEALDHAAYAYSLSNPDNVAMLEHLRYGMMRADAWRSLVLLLLGGGAVALVMVSRREKKWIGTAAVTVLVLFDLYNVDKRYVSNDSFCDRAASASPVFMPDAIDQAILADTTASYRVLDIPGFDSPDRSYFHKMLGGYHAAKLIRYEDLIQRRLRPMMAVGYEPEFRNMPDSALADFDEQSRAAIKELRANYRVLDMLNARYIITGKPDAPVIVNTRALGNAWLVDTVRYVEGADAEMAALSEINPAIEAVADSRYRDVLGNVSSPSHPGDSIYMTYYSPNTLKYRAIVSQPAIGVFSEIYFPWGWKAYIDDKPVELARVNYLLRAMPIPAGSHTIEMTFDPDSIHTSSTLAYICVTIIYMLLLLGVFAAVRRRWL